MGTKDAFDTQFDEAGQQYDVDPRLLKTVYMMESSGNPNTPNSEAGAEGGMQLMPATARALGVTDSRDMSQAIPAAAKYIRQGLDATGSPEGALQYYFGGPDQRIWGPKTTAYAIHGQTLYPSITIKTSGKSDAPDQSSSTDQQPAKGSVLDQLLNRGESDVQPAPGGTLDRLLHPNTDTSEPTPGGTLASMLGAEQTTPAVPAAEQVSPAHQISSDFGAGVARGVRDVGDLAAPYLSSGVKALANNPVSQYIDSKFPALAYLDQKYSQTDPAAIAQAKSDYEAQHGDSLAAGIGRFAGQVLPTLPVTGGIGAIGEGLAGQAVGMPVTQGILKLATAASQGGAAAGMTGGDVGSGMVTGGALGALGAGSKVVSNSLQNGGALSTMIHSKIADKLVAALSSGVGYHLGDITGFLAGGAIGPVIKEITEKYGPKIAGAVTKMIEAGNRSGISTGAGGTAGGKVDPTDVGNLLQGYQ